MIRSVDSDAVDSLFDELERYDSRERAETFESLKRALNKTRSSLGAEGASGKIKVGGRKMHSYDFLATKQLAWKLGVISQSRWMAIFAESLIERGSMN